MRKNTWVSGTVIFICFIAVVSFVISPLTGDLKVFMGGANQVQYADSDNWGLNVLQTWDMKGFLNRATMFLIYKIATVFTTFASLEFEHVCKLIYILVALLLLGGAVKMWSKRISCRRSIFLYSYLVIFLFNTDTFTHMQAEMSSVLLMILSFSIFMSQEKSWLKFISGFLFSFVFFFKSIFPIMGLTFLAGIYFIDSHGIKNRFREIVLFLCGCAVSLLGGLLLFYFVYPQELVDMWDASMFQATMLSGANGYYGDHSPLMRFVYHSLMSLRPSPYLIICCGLIIYRSISLVKKQEYLKFIYLLIMFIAPTAFIVISNAYFRYHYYMYAFPAVIILLEMIDSKDEIVEHIKEKKFPYLLSIAALVVCSYLLLMNFNEKYSIISSAILLCVFVSYIFLFLYGRVTLKHLIITFLSLPTLWYISYCSIISPRVHNNIESEKMYRTLNKETLDQLEISPSSKILYLDDGGTPYVLGNESVCRYLYPLPIERPTPKEKQLKCYFNTLNDCINYKGEWIFYAEEWMEECMYNNPQIAQKLENEYYDTGLKLYCISCPPLHLGKKEIASFVYAGGISIYKKNQ